MKLRGFLLFELILGLAVFSITISGILISYRYIEENISDSGLRGEAIKKAQEELVRTTNILSENFYITFLESTINKPNMKGEIFIKYENAASRIIESIIYYSHAYGEKKISLQQRITEPPLALGKSTCGDNFNIDDINKMIKVVPSGIELGLNNTPTHLDVVGNYLFISTNSAKASDPDLFIFNVQNINSISLLSKISTGPGISSLQVVGKYIYVANKSINGQLQVIDASDLTSPQLIKTIKLPGVYNDNTTIGKKIFYDNGKLFLGTDKSMIQELHMFNAAELQNPIWQNSIEIGAGINSLAAYHKHLYVASPAQSELMVFEINDFDPQLIHSFLSPPGLGNGKALDNTNNEIVLGRTTGSNELYIFDTKDGLKQVISTQLKTSINEVIYKNNYIFSLTSNNNDFFQIFEKRNSQLERINDRFSITSKGVAMDCDEKTFFILTVDPMRPLVLITPNE